LTRSQSAFTALDQIRGGKKMGLFDKMFGRGASDAQQQPNAQQRFNELKGKYQSGTYSH
jgi:hypothetical protein